ncbi:MAG: dihydropteroate synthase [Acidimicrobiia bacterium]
MRAFEILRFGGVTHVMAVINLSPESRNLHTVAANLDDARAMAHRYRDWGASVIDLGGQSSHYDNPTISSEEELARLIPAVTALAGDGFVVSIDTWKPEVAWECLAAGATIVNDTGGLKDPAMVAAVARSSAAAVVVYVEGRNPHDVGVIDTGAEKARRTAELFRERLRGLEAAGLIDVIIDPGIALNYRGDYEAYTRLQLEVIRESAFLRELNRPVLIPIPRKRELNRVMAFVTLALEYQADMIRVHDVKAACDLARLFDRLPYP